MNKPVLTVTLNPAVDKTICIKGFRAGKEYRCGKCFSSAGGKGINVSRALGNLGVKSIATGFIAGVAGEYIKNEIYSLGVKSEFVNISGDTRTNLTILDKNNNNFTRILELGPLVTNSRVNLFKKKYLSLLENCSSVVLSGRNVPGAKDTLYAELVRSSKKCGKLTILDSSGKAFVEGLKAKPYLIKPNLNEAEYVLKRKLSSICKIKKGVEYFLNKGVTLVIISLSSRGAIASDGVGFWHAIPPKQEVHDSVGRGDALIAGFIYAQSKKCTFAQSLRIAVAAGTAYGLGGLPSCVELSCVKRLVNKVKLKSI